MTRSEFYSLNLLMALYVHLATTELLFNEFSVDELPDEVRDEVAAYERRTKDLKEKLRNCIIPGLEPLLTEEE